MHKLKDVGVILITFVALGGFLFFKHKQENLPHTRALLSERAYGTPARSEREFKVSVNDTNLTSKEVEAWAHEMKALLAEKVGDIDYWAAPNLVGQKYFVENDVKTYLYRDIYFDTEDELCKQHNVSYRLRNRFKTLPEHNEHFKDLKNEEWWPYRAEFQAKYDRKEEASGFSSVMEARFEFREESEPFSKDNPPPGPPWALNEYIPYFQSGRFAGMVTYPAQDVMRFFADKTDKEELEFEPVLVFITERTRQHLHIETPWGYGPNPTQAYIISFDNVSVYDAGDYLGSLGSGTGLQSLTPVGKLVELEVEFERNVSQNLDIKIEEAGARGDKEEASRLQRIRDAFISDQQTIIRTLADFLKDNHQLELTMQKQSKFGQTHDFKEEPACEGSAKCLPKSK